VGALRVSKRGAENGVHACQGTALHIVRVGLS